MRKSQRRDRHRVLVTEEQKGQLEQDAQTTDAVAGDQNVKLEVNGRDLSGWENTVLCSSYLEVNGRATASK
jgi:hypothetical protein